MNWEQLEKNVYHEDGSLRDIYIRDVTLEDWRRWIDYVNDHYTVEFATGSLPTCSKIDFSLISDFWYRKEQERVSASIFLGNILVKTYFFLENEIENDIDPNEINSLADHETLLVYLRAISTLLEKKVELTEENGKDPSDVLMIVIGDSVLFPHA